MPDYKLVRIRPSSFVDRLSVRGGKVMIEIGGSTYQGDETTLPSFGGLSRAMGWHRLPTAIADKVSATFGSAVVDCMTQEEAIALESKETIAALRSEVDALRAAVTQVTVVGTPMDSGFLKAQGKRWPEGAGDLADYITVETNGAGAMAAQVLRAHDIPHTEVFYSVNKSAT